MAAALPIGTVSIGCPECGTPIHVTLKVEHKTPIAKGGKFLELDVSAPDAADEVRTHIARGDCGRHPLPADG
jgi:phage FluMu protein Com